MADDLDDEWWKAEDDKEHTSPADDSKKEKRVLKRPAPSDDSVGEESEDSTPDKALPEKKARLKVKSPQQKKQKSGNKKKKKNSRGKFVRRKITEEDEGSLKKAGTPADVNTLLKPLVAVSEAVNSDSESDEDSNDNTLSVEEGGSEESQTVPGSPLILILCSSAVRAVELNRELKPFLGKECKTAKLFAKHMKLEEQKVFLQKKVCHACIGTPNRVQALLEAGSLKLNNLHAIVLDWNWRDVKLKRMVDIPDVRRDLTLLLKEHAFGKIRKTPCRVAIL